eukprot:CAMPEP_0204428420 /NCGR_PEP_ID=MMETSP0470-20130426/57721_1 /ASSEMBLY_ACC=CAM_ASM_000385 /TAXON_ID=2969 /ORGANISM="Oxyrrhis marina" /LENGTH=99 /DNA_ID=CAMNT_0051426327 /DNA_START=42 /DNA_END=338 /DNA_ORIENTATION=-
MAAAWRGPPPHRVAEKPVWDVHLTIRAFQQGQPLATDPEGQKRQRKQLLKRVSVTPKTGGVPGFAQWRRERAEQMRKQERPLLAPKVAAEVATLTVVAR